MRQRRQAVQKKIEDDLQKDKEDEEKKNKALRKKIKEDAIKLHKEQEIERKARKEATEDWMEKHKGQPPSKILHVRMKAKWEAKEQKFLDKHNKKKKEYFQRLSLEDLREHQKKLESISSQRIEKSQSLVEKFPNLS